MIKTKVCHFTSGHDANDARVFQKQCQTLSEANYEVHLVVPSGKTEVKNGINIWSINAGGYGRFTRMILISREIYKKAVAIDADIYHFHDPELIPYGVKLKKIGKKVIYDSHEDTPADILNKSWIPLYFRWCVSVLYGWYEKSAARKFDGVVSVTPHIVEKFKIAKSNAHLITNYPIIDSLPAMVKKTSADSDNSIRFVGRICPESMQPNIIKAINEIEGIRYIFAGPADEDYLRELSKISGWSKCEYRGKITFAEANDFVAEGIAGVQITDYIPNFGYKIGSLGNTKLFTYMAAGLPVICSDMILWKRIMDEYSCGICVNPSNIAQIRDAIIFLRDNPKEARQMGENGRKAIMEKYNWGSQIQTLLNLYKSVL